MSTNRRKFLSIAGVGLTGVASLLATGQARAWGRRRRNSCCAADVAQACVAQAGARPIPQSSFGPISIAYPDAPTVPGGGTFFTWGTLTGTVTNLAATVTWTGGSRPGVAAPTGSGYWAFRFDMVPTGVNLTLTVSGNTSGVTTSSSVSSFQCV